MALHTVTRPKQARSQQTLERLLDAAQGLIEERGLKAVSIPEVVRRAKSSVGGFYGRFRDKDELLRALEERFFRELERRIEETTQPEQWAEASLPTVLESLIGTMVEIYSQHRRLIKAFLVRAAQDELTFSEGLRLRQRVFVRVGQLVLERRDEVAHPDPQRALQLALHMLFGVMQQKAIFGEVRAGAGPAMKDAELVHELTRAVLAYLQSTSPEGQ